MKMEKNTYKQFAVKVAENDRFFYTFYPYAPYRLIGILILPTIYFFGFVFYFLMDFQINTALMGYLILATLISLFLIFLSFRALTIDIKNNTVKISSLFKKSKSFSTKEIQHIFYKKSRTPRFRDTITFYLILKSNKKIRLCTGLQNKSLTENSFTESHNRFFDDYKSLINNLAYRLAIRVKGESKEEIDKKKKRENIFIKAFVTCMVFYIILLNNPIWWIIYGLIFGSIVFLMSKEKNKGKAFIVASIIGTFLAILIIPFSPYLKIQDFKLFHPNYELLSDFTITDAEIKHYSSSPSAGYRYNYAKINYTYTINNQEYHQTEEDVIKWNANYNENRKQLAELVKRKDFYVFVNTQNPNESKMFYSNQYLYLKGSEAYYFFRYFLFSFIGIFLLIVFSGMVIYIKVKKGSKKEVNNI